MCIRARADWAMLKSILFPGKFSVEAAQTTRSQIPDELTDRLRGDALFSYLANNSFTVSRRQQFKLSLDINVGRPLLTLMVREFFPLDIPEVQHTYRSLLGADGIVTYGRHQVWSPPINISIERGELPRSIERLRVQIRNMFVQVLDNRDDWDRWAMIYFPETDEDFQTDIIIRVGKYYRSDIPEHSVLKQALSLLWFEHLLLTKARVPADAVAALETKLESRRPAGLPGDARVVPDTINRFIKGVVLPMAEKAGQKLTESLHEMMFKLAVGHMNLTPARMDLCLCLAFVLLIYLAKTQHALLLLADAPANETGREYGVENARERIEQMDDVIAEYVVQFHKYTLTRRSGRSPGGSGGSPADEDSAFEQHAREFDLPGELRALAQEYGKFEPLGRRLT